MNKAELIAAISKKRRINQPVLEMAYDEIFSAIIEAVAQGENVVIENFGIFYPQIQHSNSEQISSTKTIPGFIADSHFKEALETRSKSMIIELRFTDRNRKPELREIACTELLAPNVLEDQDNFFVKCSVDSRIVAGAKDVPLLYVQCRGQRLRSIEVVRSPEEVA